MTSKFRVGLTTLSLAASLSLVSGMAVGTSAYAHGNGHGNSGTHGKSGQHGNAGKHGNSGKHSNSGSNTTTGNTTNTTTTNTNTNSPTSNTMNASQTCSSTGNAVLSYASTTNGTTTNSNIPISHGACVSAMKSHGHSSAIAASLCKYLVKNGGTFNNVSLLSSFPTGTTATTLTNILGKLATNTTAPTNVGQCVKMYNQAKHAVLSGH